MTNTVETITEKDELHTKIEELTHEQQLEVYDYLLETTFNEAIEALSDTQSDHERKAMRKFAEHNGVAVQSGYCILYMGFRWGFEKGMDIMNTQPKED